MKPRLFESVEKLVCADGLASILGCPVKAVERTAFQNEGFSGADHERVSAMDSAGQTAHFVLKHLSIEQDWVMSGTQDSQFREAALFLNGVYQRLPQPCYVPILAVAREGKSRAVLMVDVSNALLPSGDRPVPPAAIKQFLDHLAALHAHFMGDESLEDVALGLCSLRNSTLFLAPAAARRALALGQEEAFMRTIIAGWETFETVAPVEAVRIVTKLQQDAQPLLNALATGPRTLLHGDYKLAHLGSVKGPRTLMLDWTLATWGPPLLDLGWFLAVNSARLSIPKAEAIQLYCASLAAHGCPYPPEDWTRDLALGLLAGGAMRLMWSKALGTQAEDAAVRERETGEVQWWSEQIIRAGRWLG